KAEYKRSGRYIERSPVAEYHYGQRQESVTRNFAGGSAVSRGKSICKSSYTGQSARNSNAGVSHLIYIDTKRVRWLRIFTAGSQPETESGLVEYYGKHYEDRNAYIRSQIYSVY